MPLHSPQLSFSIETDENELETFDVKHEGRSLITAFVTSQAGEVSPLSSSKSTVVHEPLENTNGCHQQFRVTYRNNMLDIDLAPLSSCVSTERSFVGHIFQPDNTLLH